jgi:hypothetical protein
VPVSPGLTYQWIPDAALQAVSLPWLEVKYAVALNEAGEIVSCAGFDRSKRGTGCLACTQTCYWGGIVYTRADYRRQGIFKDLFAWGQAELEADPIYISENSTSQKLIAFRYELRIPLVLPPRAQPALEAFRAFELLIPTIEEAMRV